MIIFIIIRNILISKAPVKARTNFPRMKVAVIVVSVVILKVEHNKSVVSSHFLMGIAYMK